MGRDERGSRYEAPQPLVAAKPRLVAISLTAVGVLDGSCRDLPAWQFCRGLGSGGVLRGLEPVADADGDRSGGLDGVRGEERATRATGDAGNAWEGGEAADGDEDGREGGHHLGVLGREEVERVAGVEEPDRRLCLGRGDCKQGPWVRTYTDRVWVWVRGLRTFALGSCGDRDRDRECLNDSGRRGGRATGCGGWG